LKKNRTTNQGSEPVTEQHPKPDADKDPPKDPQKPRVVEAEVVKGGRENPDTRELHTGAPHQDAFRGRYSRRFVYLQSGGRPVDENRLRHMRGRFGLFALTGLGIAGGLVYMATATESVFLAAVLLILALFFGAVGLFMIWIWRVLGKLLSGNFRNGL
jgi:hypothetical protein